MVGPPPSVPQRPRQGTSKYCCARYHVVWHAATNGRPSTLAVADLGPDGTVRYEFYLTGTASAALDYAVLTAALPHGVTAVHAGTLSLVMEPIASAIERLITDGLPPDALVMVDPNCRPAAIGDRDAYLDRFERILHRADVVKVSMEDLDYLCPGVPAEVAATTLLGDRPALVLVTDGPRPARAFLSGGFGGAGGEVSVEVPRVEVVDTIGAGDAFGGGFLAWWSGAGLGRKELSSAEPVAAAFRAAAEVSALTCTRAAFICCTPVDMWPMTRAMTMPVVVPYRSPLSGVLR